MKKSIVVIGAGFGGLTSAALLAQAGHKVTLLEQRDWIGGKSRRLTINNQTIDSGPSLVTFSQVWQSVLDKYASLGGKVENQPKFHRLTHPTNNLFDCPGFGGLRRSQILGCFPPNCHRLTHPTNNLFDYPGFGGLWRSQILKCFPPNFRRLTHPTNN